MRGSNPLTPPLRKEKKMYLVHHIYSINNKAYVANYTAEQILETFKKETANPYSKYIDIHEIVNIIEGREFNCTFIEDNEEENMLECCWLSDEIHDIIYEIASECEQLMAENIEEFDDIRIVFEPIDS
jgi:hypothetical protein